MTVDEVVSGLLWRHVHREIDLAKPIDDAEVGYWLYVMQCPAGELAEAVGRARRWVYLCPERYRRVGR